MIPRQVSSAHLIIRLFSQALNVSVSKKLPICANYLLLKKGGTMPSITQTDHARIISGLLAIYIRKFNAPLITFLHYMICRIHCDYINPQGIRMTRSRHNVESTSQLMSLLYKVMSTVLYKMLKSTRRIKVCRLNKSGGEYLVIYGTQLRVKWQRGGLQKCKCLSS